MKYVIPHYQGMKPFYINIFYITFNKICNFPFPGHEAPSTLIYSTLPSIKYIITHYQVTKPLQHLHIRNISYKYIYNPPITRECIPASLRLFHIILFKIINPPILHLLYFYYLFIIYIYIYTEYLS